MAKSFLAHGRISSLLARLSPFGEIRGPILTPQRVLGFGPVNSADDLVLDYRRTLIPPKKYLLPPRETILAFTPACGYEQPPIPEDPIVLIGLHPCDLNALASLDEIFLCGEADPSYRKRRKRLTLVGVTCEPDEFCFCGDGAGDGALPCDLFLAKREGGYLLSAHTRRGRELLRSLGPILSEEEAVANEVSRTGRRPPPPTGTLPEGPLWEEFADRCLGCGACSLCCPTCYCFALLEHGAIDGAGAQRVREWDNCLFRSHGAVAGGASFRPTRRERFHYRFLHKYYGFGAQAGRAACVGCGRCREVCPARIDLTELFAPPAGG